MRFAVWGTGGVAGYFGGRLAEAGEDVTFLARGTNLAAFRQDGLAIQSALGDAHIRPVQATDDPGAIGHVDVIIVGTKAWQVPEAAEAMRAVVGPETVALPLQNGVDAPRELADILGSAHALGGLCRILCSRVAPGVIRHHGVEPVIVAGELDNRRSERLEALRVAFEGTHGASLEIATDIHVALWEKFIFITAISSLSAITRAPIGIVRQEAGSRRLLRAVLDEIHAVGRAHGVALPDETVDRWMTFLDTMPADGVPSMARDIAEGNPSELDQQCGAVVRLGRETSTATPVSDTVYECLRPLDRRARGLIDFAAL